MKLEVTNLFTPEGKEFFEYNLYDGPDGIEKVHGYATDLIVAFTKILEWREKIARDYLEGETCDDFESPPYNEGGGSPENPV